MKNRFLVAVMAFALMLAAQTSALAGRQNLTAKAPTIGAGGIVAANAADLTFTAADITNHEQVTITGREIVVVNNTGGSPYTVTFTSAPDALGRTGDITAYPVSAAGFAVFGPFPLNGWKQTTGKLYMSASNAAVKYAVITLPQF